MQKPKYKEKLRLRFYPDAPEEKKVFLEIKKKYHGIVNKRRTVMTRKEAEFFVNFGIRPDYKDYMNKQVIDELEYFIKRYKPEPKVCIAYDRLAFFEKENPDLRISFDKNIRARLYDVPAVTEDWGVPLLEKGAYLMEIKARYSKPLWLVHLLSKEKIQRVSFSKYGTYYKMLLQFDYEENCINL